MTFENQKNGGAQEACCRAYAMFRDRHGLGCPYAVPDVVGAAGAGGRDGIKGYAGAAARERTEKMEEVAKLANEVYGLPITSDDPGAHRSLGMRCATCMWYAVGAQSHPLGRCRRHAPTMSGYPVVFHDDWCGDHKLKEG